MLFQWLLVPFVLARVGEEIEGKLVSALVVVANEGADEHVTAQTVSQLADFHLVVVFISPFQTVDLHLVIKMTCTKRGEKPYQLDKW